MISFCFKTQKLQYEFNRFFTDIAWNRRSLVLLICTPHALPKHDASVKIQYLIQLNFFVLQSEKAFKACCKLVYTSVKNILTF